ncbi:unnamed protein product [Cylicocyclus nassatus]|uniref:Uncharacterized protein n=1 Tax=Cylicocyclus nassatus TaxID=53992 RepID=A0AA36DQG8_CYLNA|nr:unnamed protein product [Cylicocyclus nassatus]
MKKPLLFICMFCGVSSRVIISAPQEEEANQSQNSTVVIEASKPNTFEEDSLPPELPKLTLAEKLELIRRSGQDPARRRRARQITRVQKMRRDLALTPWRITHVVPRKPPTPKRPDRPAVALPVDMCPDKFDAITRGYNGRTYAFARDRVYQMWYEDDLPQKASYLITELFPGGPRSVSAALTNSRSGVTILINKRTAYRFRWNRKHKRFQLARNTPQELPLNITTPQTAFEWMDGNQVLLSGDRFVIYDAYWNLATFSGQTKKYFPKLPRDLLGIVYTGGNTMLMYTKAHTIKVYNAKKYRILQEYPLKINEYFGCLLR